MAPNEFAHYAPEPGVARDARPARPSPRTDRSASGPYLGGVHGEGESASAKGSIANRSRYARGWRGREYALGRGAGYWELTFAGRQAVFKHELGALYVACLLLDPPREPIHAVALALKARGTGGPGAGELVQQRSLGLDEAAAVRGLWRRQRELERILEDDEVIEPVKAEALRELEEVTEYLRKSPWRSRGGAERCVRAVTAAIKRFHRGLAGAVDAEGGPHPVLRAFAGHLQEYLLVPSGRGGGWGRAWAAKEYPGCFIYEPPRGVVWSAECGVGSGEPKVQSLESKV